MPVVVWVLACAGACSEKPAVPPAESLRKLAPPPLAPLEGTSKDAGSEADREQAFQLAPAPVFGEEPPPKAVRLALTDRQARLGEEDFALESREAMQRLKEKVKMRGAPVLLSAQGGVFLAQVAPALEALDDAEAEVWIQHPADRAAFPVLLRDEPSFQVWIDEPKLGKVRAIQRADGFELMTKIGKLPGADPNGPTVPVRGGQMDVATLRRGLARLQERFPKADDACLVPSFGTEVQAIARALTGFWSSGGEPVYSQVCLVYPRPVAPRQDGGR